MTVSSDVNKITYAGNGSTQVFSVNYYFLADSHLQVVLITTAGVETVQTLTTNYTVTGAGNEAGGSITMLVAPPIGTSIVIQRVVPATQETDYLANDPFPAESHERALDKLTMLVQQNERENERSLKIPLSAVPTTSTELPAPVGNKLLAWNSNASAVINFDPADVITIVGQQTSYGDVFTGNGVTTDFTLARSPGSVFGLDVSINGVTQVPNVDYTLGGTTLTFTSAPPAAASQILARYAEVYEEVSADAQNVRYLPAGVGAVTTTVQAKLRETVSVKDFGAVGDGVTDDTAAIQAAIDVHDTVEFSDGNYLVLSEITIPTSGKMLVGTGGTIVRGATLGVNGVFYATNKNNLTFKNLNFIVQTTQTHDQVGQFIGLNLCNECRIIDCVFDAELKNQITNKESLFSAVNSPNCNRLLIQGNVFRYLYGNCCGANDGAGTGVNGQNVTIVGNVFYNHVDTGVGNWTNASNVTITGNVFERNDYSTSYNGVHIDVAGASYVSIVGNSFKGNTIGIRMLSNLGYSNNGILIEGNTFEDQVTGSSEPATGIKVSHYTNGATSNNEDVIIRGNTFKVKVWGVNVSSTVTDLSKVLTIQIDGNKFDLSEPSCVGVALQRLNPFGSVKHIPGSNTFVGAGAGAVAVGGNGSGTEMHLTSQQNSAVHRSNFQFTGAVAQNLASFYAERGCYSLAASVGTCVDGGGVGGVQTFNTLNGAPLTCINTGGSNQVISASVSNTKWDSFFYVVPIDGDYEAKLNPHVSGNTIDYYYLSVVRII